jgi:phospholipase/lecithinase/hemolysin
MSPWSTAHAATSSYSGIVAFGDSLTDTGNFTALASGLSFGLVNFPSPAFGYAQGRFSDGRVAIEYLAESLSLNLTNYAVGGAKTGPSALPGLPDNYIDEDGESGFPAGSFQGTGVAAQVASHVAGSGGTIDGQALYFVWAGPNDYFSLADQAVAGAPEAIPALTSAYIANAIGHLQVSVHTLYAAGARSFLIPNMPNLGVTPFALAAGPQLSALATQTSALHNFHLSGLLGGLTGSLTDARFFTSDTFALTTLANLDPAGSGYANSTDMCQFNPSCADPASYLYWDDVHITTAAHEALAGQFAQALVPVPEVQTWAMLLAGLGLIGVAGRLRVPRVQAHTAALREAT